MNLLIKKIRSGSNVFDWKVPFEWNVVDAYILDKKKNKIVNFKTNNIHLVEYSVPVKKYLEKLGWQWTPTMFIGQGCKVHLKKMNYQVGS